ncbi:hypothetical protein QTP86_016213 [Hemibagrus guttatus]|nr:hypothetical protein QTP86_016213 [Hemibagrus guttatus]
MPPPDRRAKTFDRPFPKPKEKDLLDLRRLLSFVSVPFSKQQGNQSKGRKPQNSPQVNENRKHMRPTAAEAAELEKFSVKYREQRHFSRQPHHSLFSDIFTALIRNRLNCSEWLDHSSPENILRVLICLRLLIREPHYQKVFHELHGLIHLSKHMESVSTAYLENKERALETEQLVTMTYVCQKMAMAEEQRKWLIDCEAHKTLGKLLSARDSNVLLGALLALTTLADSPECKEKIGELCVVENLLVILQEYDMLSKRERAYVSDRSSIATLSSANAAGRLHTQHVCEDLSPHEAEENTVALHAACCAAITELVLDDAAAHHVVQENGVYILGKLILPHGPKSASLQCYAFRTLRFLFSMERNRHLFKRLFPPELFEMFIDIGHYVRDIAAYIPLQERISVLSTEELDGLKERIEAVNQNRPPLRVINGYSVLDPLGSGAFGTVFKVRKQGAQNCLALKEVNLHNPAFGHDKKSRDSNVEKIVSELTIIKEQMTHPNIVKYLKTFLECDRLYIVMELVEGAPLAEHFSSLKEKQQTFTEERVWNIFIQMCLALRYLHKEKRIVHRDLTPNNIMLGERDKVTITDFGLAKQKQETSKLTSVVGTILYSCPEIVKNEPYGEKADVWAAGCVLYQMVTLRPPFYSNNMLSLATKIVEAEFELVENTAFSERVTDMIKWCLTPNADLRPDIVEVSSRICDLMMKFLDGVNTSHNVLEKRAERDRRRAQKYCIESNRLKLTCCRPPQVDSTHQAEHTTLSSCNVLTKYYYCAVQPGMDFNDEPLVGQHAQQSETRNRSFSDSVDEVANVQVFIIYSRNITCFIQSGSKHRAELKAQRPNSGHKMRYIFTQAMSQQLPLSRVQPQLRHIYTNIGPRVLTPSRSLMTKADLGSAGICVSHRKVRQIDDPNLRLLELLHKIIFVTQLPPGPQTSFSRRAIERFKKSLFQREISPFQLKMELNKVLQGSQEVVELGSGSRDWWSMVQSGRAETHGELGFSSPQEGITYEQVQVMIEDVLEQSTYYSTPPARSESETGNSRTANL